MVTERNLLLINPYLSTDPGKSFYTLILKYLNHLGWNSTIVSLPPRHVLNGTSRWERPGLEPTAGLPVDHNGLVHTSSGAWSGINIIEVSPLQRGHTHATNWFYRQRRKFSSEIKTLRAEGRHLSLKAGLLTASNLGLLPFTAIRGPVGALSNSSLGLWDVLLALHRQQAFSVVLSIYGTFLSHDLARRFKALTGVPWVALMKDFYSRPAYVGSKSQDIPSWVHWLVNAQKQRHEGRTLNDSNMLVPYTNVLADHLGAITSGVPIRVIPNCYDDDDYIDPVDSSGNANNSKFVIGSVGRLWDYDLHLFFQALREIKEEGNCPDIKARFVGANVDLLQAIAGLYDCQSLLEIVPVVPHKEAVMEMRQSTCLLSPQVAWELPRRTPEYVATGRPILAFPDCPTAVSQEILQQYGGAVIASNKEELKATLLDWYREFKATGKIGVQVNDELVRSFSARHRAVELDQVLNEVVSVGHQGEEDRERSFSTTTSNLG